MKLAVFAMVFSKVDHCDWEAEYLLLGICFVIVKTNYHLLSLFTYINYVNDFLLKKGNFYTPSIVDNDQLQ